MERARILLRYRKSRLALIAACLGVVTIFFQVHAQPRDPDVNDDGIVNILDVSLIGSCIGTDPTTVARCAVADVNGDGAVGLDDLQLVITSFGSEFPVEPSDTTPPTLSITAPQEGSILISSTPAIHVTYSDDTGVDTSTLAFEVNGSPLEVDCQIGETAADCTPTLPLEDGATTLVAAISDTSGNITSATVNYVVDTAPVEVSIATPIDRFITRQAEIEVSGDVGDDVVSLTINGVATNFGSPFSARVPLREGTNMLVAIATNANGRTGVDSIEVTRDIVAPIVRITTPRDGFFSANDSIVVAGQVNDIVNGATEARVFVNGVEASVTNRTFVLEELHLVRGPNTIEAVARDAVGNESRHSVSVTFQEPVGQRVSVLSGNGQIGTVNQPLATPLVVVVADDLGNPVAGRIVEFDVTRNNGTLRTAAADEPLRTIRVVTNGSGHASALFTLGDTSGAGNNRVVATALGVTGEVEFCASATPGIPDKILGIGGLDQTGVVGEPLADPLEAMVVDVEGNPLEGIPVTYQVVEIFNAFVSVEKSGNFGGEESVVRLTGSDGIARAVLTLGPNPGVSNNIVEASFEGLVGLEVTFVASGKAPTSGSTLLSGVVLDSGLTAIPGSVITIDGTSLSTTTNGEGMFLLEDVPVGHIVLHIDPTSSPRPETFPPLSFETVTIAGVNNDIGQPIIIPALDNESSKIVGGDEDVVVTMTGVEGLTLKVFANSVTFPDGSKTGGLTISQVHLDKVPMPPPSGTFFMPPAWTIQPAGVVFDPPAQITIPNDGLPPGRVIDIFQFDHALNEFINVAKGTVSDDAFIIVSDPGFGITRAGWGGCGQPPPPNTKIRHESEDEGDDGGDGGDDEELVVEITANPNFVALNSDDDNANDEADKDETGTVAGEDDLVPVTITVPDGLTEGILTLTSGSSKIKVWEAATKGLPSPMTWNLETDTVPSTLYVEGVETSIVSGDANLTLSFDGDADIDPDSVNMTVVEVNLTIHKPRVIDSDEAPIPEADELDKGAQTFVNLDNDDQDDSFDTGTSDTIVLGEDEMTKLILELKPASLTDGNVILSAIVGAEDVKVWKAATKNEEYTFGDDLTLSGLTAGKLELWVEGIKPHTTQQATKLEMVYDQLPSTSDRVALTIIGIKSMVFKGKGNSLTDTDELDVDPNFPAGLGVVGLRVFSDSRNEASSGISPGPARDKVDVEVVLTVAPIEDAILHFRSFDVDDPTSATAPVDNDTATGPPHDNRGSAPAHAGKIVGSNADGILAQTFGAGESMKTFEFQTTMQPGDNFRLAGNGDPDFIGDLVAKDTRFGGNNADGQRIINEQMTNSAFADREVRDAGKYATDTLTVWRFMHVENDSMAAPPANVNHVTGAFLDFESATNVATNVTEMINSNVVFSDGSPDLDGQGTNGDSSPPVATHGDGRFENGTVVLGTASPTATVAVTASGLRRLRFADRSILPLAFSAEDNDFFLNRTMSGTVTEITKDGGSFVYALNVEESNDTTAVSFVDIPGYANNVDVKGDFAYVAAGAAGLQVVDVSDPVLPVIVASLDTPGNANDVKVVGNTAFVADGSSGLQLVDVTDPSSPMSIGAVDTPGVAQDVVVRGSLAYVADGDAGLQIIDLTVRSILGTVDTPGTAAGVDVDTSIAVVADRGTGILVMDISVPTNPFIVGGVDTGDAFDVVLNSDDDFAFVAEGSSNSFTSVDISNPADPFIRATTDITLGGILRDVALGNGFAFGAEISFANGVPIIDVSEPANPVPRAVLDFSNFRDDKGTGIAVDSEFAYLTAAIGITENGVEGDTRLYIGQHLADFVGGFVGGFVAVGGGPSLTITAADGAATPPTITTAMFNIPFDVNDDDVPTAADFSLPRKADVSLIQDTDTKTANLWAPAYIRPKHDGFGDNLDVPFLRNADHGNVNALVTQLNMGRDTEDAESATYWIVYTQSGYESGSYADGDPDTGDVVAGVALVRGFGNFNFLEGIRDAASTHGFDGIRFHAQVNAHEIGHQWGLAHPDGNGPNGSVTGIMTDNASFLQPADLKFSDVSLDKIREVIQP